MEKLNHPKTIAMPEMNRRMLAQDYIETFKGINDNGKIFDVYISIKADDKFTWDGMSIPWLAQRYVGNPFGPKHELAGLVHDWLYFIQIYPKSVCDRVMRFILQSNGETNFKSTIMYNAVKWAGGSAWRHHNKQIKDRCQCKTEHGVILKSGCIIHRTEMFLVKHDNGSLRLG